MDATNRHRVKEFLKANLDLLQGENLKEFMDKYSILEANHVQMMILDQGMMGSYIALDNPRNPGHYFVATEDVLEKILILAPLDPNTEGALQ
jgi:hypothetical protein